MKHEKNIRIILEIAKTDRREPVFHHDHVTGGEIKEVAHLPLSERLYLFREGAFKLVGNDETIVIKDKEHFIVVPHGAIHYSVNDEPQCTTDKELTPKQIMQKAGIDPDQNYLAEVEPHHESFKETPEKPIHLHDGMKFITHFIGPKPVSNC